MTSRGFSAARSRARRGNAATLAALAMLAGAACSRHRVASYPDPTTARRLEILSTSDTLFRFITRDARWIRRGTVGLAVDPRRHDALVARYFVESVAGDTATARVTGLTTDLSVEHVALVARPRYGLLRQRAFWIGLAGGVAATVAAAAAR